MINGIIIVNGDAGKFLAANKKTGVILAKSGNPLPITKEKPLSTVDRNVLIRYGFNPQNFKKFE